MIRNINETLVLRPRIYLIPEMNQPEFESSVKYALCALEKIPIGKRLIEKVGNSKHEVFIQFTKDFFSCVMQNESLACTLGKGCNSIIEFSISNRKNSEYPTTTLKKATRPSYIDFAHELIHAYHNTQGKNARLGTKCDKFVWSNDEEYHTIMGFISKKTGRKSPKITENAILSALGLPERFGHASFENLKIKKLNYERTKLLSEIYNQFCKKNGYSGQAANQPPPILNCNLENFVESERLVMLMTIRPLDSESESQQIISLLNFPIPSGFLKEEFNDNEELVDVLQVKNILPNFRGEVISSGLYRLTCAETEILDQEFLIENI